MNTRFGIFYDFAAVRVAWLASTFARFRYKVAPADGDLINSSFALWLDDTPGATKLMVKAKDSAGTVRTGEIPLS